MGSLPQLLSSVLLRKIYAFILKELERGCSELFLLAIERQMAGASGNTTEST